LFAAIPGDSQLARLARLPAALDALTALWSSCDRASISDASLAAACADARDDVSAVAGGFLRARAIVRGARLEASSEATASSSVAAVAAGSPASASFEEAVAKAKACGVAVLAAPRAFVSAVGGRESLAVRILRAAFSDDDEAVRDALADEIDVRYLRAAVRAAGGRPLRTSIASTLAAFGGGPERELAVIWAKRLDEVRRCARRKRSLLAAAVEATGAADERLSREAAAVDAVWESCGQSPDAVTKIALLCDAVAGGTVGDGIGLAPRGCTAGDAACELEFAQQQASPVSTAVFASALGSDETALHVPALRVAAAWPDAAAHWLSTPPRTALLARPAVEEPIPVASGPMVFSASRLNAYVMCPRRWFYEYLCAAVDERPSVQALYGKVFHAALEALHTEIRIPSDRAPSDVAARLEGELDAAFGRARSEFDSQLEYEVMRLRARRVAAHYVQWLFDQAAEAPFEIVELESRHALAVGGHRFVGYIDRIDRPPGGGPITIFDYKTGRIEEDPVEFVRRMKRGDDAQLSLYWAMARARGDEVARMALVSIRDTRDETWMLAVDVTDRKGKPSSNARARKGILRATCTAAELEASLEALLRRCTLLTTTGVDHFKAGADPPCSYCAYERACRERPADGERIFAR
jgi:RecB family exonuclease